MIEKKRELRSSDESIAMKILIVTNSFPTKKNPTHQLFVKNISEGLVEEGFEVDVIYNPYFNYFKSDLNTGGLFSSVLKTIFLFFACLPAILFRASNYDIIYSHAPVWPGFFMLAAQKLHRIPHVTYVHGSVNHYVVNRGFLYKIARFTLHKCTSVAVNSSYMENRLQKDYRCSSKVITPGYNTSFFFYKPGIRTIDLFFAGSTISRKGIRLLLETIAKYKEFYQKNKLFVKMNFSGGAKQDLIQFAHLNGINGLIDFGDKLSESELAETYKTTKVFAFPSTEEPLGLVGIEAIACGAVLVGSDSGGIKEYLMDGKNGFLFRDGDIDDLQNSIEKALNYFPEMDKKQPAISESVRDFLLSEAMKQTVSLFRELDHKKK